jgi:hypothetical protein
MKRKFLLLSIILLVVFSLTSCIDYVQSISYKDGKYHFYNKVTFSKLLMEMSDEDVDDFMEEFDEDVVSSLPDFVSANPVETDLEVGAEISFSINPKEATEEQKTFLPKKSGNKYFIPFMFSEEFSSGDFDDYEDDELAFAIFSSAKCRVLISKKIISKIEDAYFEGTDDENFEIPVFDYGDSFCLEIPFVIFFESYMYDFDRIVIIKEYVN